MIKYGPLFFFIKDLDLGPCFTPESVFADDLKFFENEVDLVVSQ
jgi:hypothetical protein